MNTKEYFISLPDGTQEGPYTEEEKVDLPRNNDCAKLPPPLKEIQYYVCEPGSKPHGPYAEAMVQKAYENNMYPGGTMVWHEGAADWAPIATRFTRKTPPPLPSPHEYIYNTNVQNYGFYNNEKRWNILNAFSSCIRRTFVYSGRSCRSEYWYFVLLCNLIAITLTISIGILSIICQMSDRDTGSLLRFIGVIYGIFIFFPTISVTVRRLHDTGTSGWAFLTYIIPLVGHIIMFAFAIQESEKAPNKYGDKPLPPA